MPDSLQSAIADFPGYGDDVSRERSDEFVRSYVGERLADLQQRLQPLDAALGDRIEALVLRSAFVNQAAYKLYDDGNDRSTINVDGVVTADAAAVAVADRASSIDAAQLPAVPRRRHPCARRSRYRYEPRAVCVILSGARSRAQSKDEGEWRSAEGTPTRAPLAGGQNFP